MTKHHCVDNIELLITILNPHHHLQLKASLYKEKNDFFFRFLQIIVTEL